MSLSRNQKIFITISFCAFLAVVIWMWQIAPLIIKLPNNFSYSADIVSLDNFYDEDKQVFPGETISLTKFFYETESVEKGIINIKNVFDVRRSTGEKIFAVERVYGIDQITNQHVFSHGDKDRTGYLFAPRWLKKGQPYVYWHINYDEPATMEYQGTENLFGLTVYRYEANYHADQTINLGFLPGVGKTRGVNLDIKLITWVEPVTGRLIKYEDYTTAYYYDLKTGEQLHPWNKFHNAYTETSTKTQVEIASNEKFLVYLIEIIIPLILVLLSIIMAILVYYDSRIKRDGFIVHPIVVALVVFLVILFITLISWWLSLQNIQRKNEEKFSLDIKKASQSIIDRLEIYKNILQGVKGLFAASEFVSREEWREYISILNIKENYPGIQGISFAPYISSVNITSHIKEIKSQGFLNYTIFPAGDRNEYVPVTYIEPFDDNNRRALGFDIFSDPIRRVALERARDSGSPALTGSITLIQEVEPNPSDGFLLVIPVYKNGEPHGTVAERRAAIVGFVTAPFQMNDFISSIAQEFNQNIALALFDANIGKKSFANETVGLMYTSDQGKFSNNASYRPRFSRTVAIAAIDYPWIAAFVSTPNYASNEPKDALPIIILGLGFLLSSALSSLIYTLATGRSRAQAYAQKVTKDLRLEEIKLRQEKTKDEIILSSIGDGFVAVDSKRKILLMNEQAIKMLKLEKSNVVGKDCHDVWSVEDGQGNRLLSENRPIQIVLASGKKITTTTTTTYWFVRSDGSKFPVALTATPIIQDGRVTGAVLIFRNITHEKEIDRAKNEFVSIASHQLKTPVTIVSLYTERLLSGREGTLTVNQKKYVTQLREANQRMINLINTLLNVSRIELGGFSINPIPLDIINVFKNILEEMELVIKEKNLIIEKKYHKLHQVLPIDESLLSIVFYNLVSNAIRYTPAHGTISIKSVEIHKGGHVDTWTAKEDSLMISISDNGCGIPHDQQNKIFTKFFRANNARIQRTDGTGLGLYIVKLILDQTGGDAWFRSVENKGTTFYFTIPLSGMKKNKGAKSLQASQYLS